MMNRKVDLHFSFMANSSDADDKSGKASWRFPIYVNGQTKEIKLDFNSYTEAKEWNDVFYELWESGRLAGYAECESKVMAALHNP